MVKRLHVGFHECMRILSERAFKGYNNTPWSVWVIIESGRMYFAIQEDIFGADKVIALCKDLDELNKFFEEIEVYD